MKRIALVVAAALTFTSTAALAGGGHGGHGGPHFSGVPFHHSGSWVGPAIIGGVIGYVLATPKKEVVVVQQEPVYIQTIPQPQPQRICETRLIKDMYNIDRMATVCYDR